jgi:hypothetical protein
MKLILHAGAHVTDNDRLIKGLLRNREGFAKQGIAIPAPRRYRALLRDTLNALSQGKPAPDAMLCFGMTCWTKIYLLCPASSCRTQISLAPANRHRGKHPLPHGRAAHSGAGLFVRGV